LRDRIVVCCESPSKSEPYIEALLVLGIDAEKILRVTPEESQPDLTTTAAAAAGVVLCGGPDLDPHR
jgi:hypothetical protein